MRVASMAPRGRTPRSWPTVLLSHAPTRQSCEIDIPKRRGLCSDTFLRGFGVVWLFHLIHVLLIPLTMGLSLILVSIFQLFYVIPIAWKARKNGESARFRGLLAAAGLTVLVNGICDAIVLPKV